MTFFDFLIFDPFDMIRYLLLYTSYKNREYGYIKGLTMVIECYNDYQEEDHRDH